MNTQTVTELSGLLDSLESRLLEAEVAEPPICMDDHNSDADQPKPACAVLGTYWFQAACAPADRGPICQPLAEWALEGQRLGHTCKSCHQPATSCWAITLI